jgi:surfactin synthase thioesterase subunit
MVVRPLPLNRTVLRPSPNPSAGVRLFCFAHAGSGASSFRPWPAFLSPEVELCAIQLPGHETRYGEPLISNLAALLPVLARDISLYLDRPFAFFGHSMGALIAFELARYLRRVDSPIPAHLFLSAFRAPHLPPPVPPVHSLPDAAFVAAIRRLNGLPSAILGDAGMMRVLLPILRADVTLCETYAHLPDAPLACAISVFGGLDDPSAGPDALAAWRVHTRHTFRLHLLPGDHFFPQTARPLILRALADDLHAVILGTNHS